MSNVEIKVYRVSPANRSGSWLVLKDMADFATEVDRLNRGAAGACTSFIVSAETMTEAALAALPACSSW